MGWGRAAARLDHWIGQYELLRPFPSASQFT